ncbi:MAG: Gfo/Idh/MocA family oxidoreductase [Polyangiaceae bacterium]|nr:Gfo/Idh/MocA family oxidoreductase [Polyangiaceae bacterium]
MKDGMNYAPKGKPRPVVGPREFVFAAAHLDHGHIYGQCNGLREAGGTLKWVYEPDAEKLARFLQTYPEVQAADSLDRILDDPEVRLVAAAAIPNLRGPLGCRVMRAGKDYFTDKTPFTTLAQLEEARQAVLDTGRKYAVYYSERLHVECAVFASELLEQGAIGRVVSVTGFGPHRLDAPSRPAWFFDREQYGGILCDIGSHQFEQFLHYSGATDATVLSATVSNTHSPAYPELEDLGEAHLLGNNGATNYVRVDWLTPKASRIWGDGRTFILGTEGYIEMRKYIEVGREDGGDQLYLVNNKVEQRFSLKGQVGFPFFGRLILDCLERTEHAMTQAHAFKAAELCLLAQAKAQRV